MKNEEIKLRIVRLLEPTLCLTCRYAAMAAVEMDSGVSRHMLHCKRLDCDNWQTQETNEVPRSIYDGS